MRAPMRPPRPPPPERMASEQSCLERERAVATEELAMGRVVIEGKTKVVRELTAEPGNVVLLNKDDITAGDGARRNVLEGKGVLSTATNCYVMGLLAAAGIPVAFVRRSGPSSFVAKSCEMLPLEVVTRRLATGSFLKRHPQVREAHVFSPPLVEYFFKDDANHDPQMSYDEIICKGFVCGGVTFGERELDSLTETALATFEILERAWATMECTLVDMKVEFGVTKDRQIVLADIIDNDSWRLWPGADRTRQMDKQVYRDMKQVSDEGMQVVKRNYEWVSDHAAHLLDRPSAASRGRVVIFMGSAVDADHAESVRKELAKVGVTDVHVRVSSAHKGTAATLKHLRRYEADRVPTVFIAIAGRSNGLGPVISGNTACPVINFPPPSGQAYAGNDIWSSLRMPSGLGCVTVLEAPQAALAAASILSMHDHTVWARMRGMRLRALLTQFEGDAKLEQ
eukprot:m51a1_g5374 Phosphoribosylaminoimidazole carboxylase, phosphoribosylaminoimidazole succinocarboxamide synthetase, putative (454) ;mRNA; r:538051-540083